MTGLAIVRVQPGPSPVFAPCPQEGAVAPTALRLPAAHGEPTDELVVDGGWRGAITWTLYLTPCGQCGWSTRSNTGSTQLRPGATGTTEVRVLFVFDPKRRAVPLVGGDKSGRWQDWYKTNIPLAEQRYERWLNNNNSPL